MSRTKSLHVNSRISIPLAEIQFTFARSSGPGGQNVNKVNSKAILRWGIANSDALSTAVKQRFGKAYGKRLTEEGELVLSSDRYRDQGRNVADCLARLQEMILAVATPPKPRKKTKTPRRAIEGRLREKSSNAKKKEMRKPPRLD